MMIMEILVQAKAIAEGITVDKSFRALRMQITKASYETKELLKCDMPRKTSKRLAFAIANALPDRPYNTLTAKQPQHPTSGKS